MTIIITVKIECETQEHERLIQDVIKQTSIPAVVKQGLYRSGVRAPLAFKKAIAKATLTTE